MSRIEKIAAMRRNAMATNLAARMGALASLAAVSIVVARLGGATGVGILSLFRVLPWLTGAIVSGGLVGACPYFLAGEDREDRTVPSTIVAMALVFGVAGGIVWLAIATPVRAVFFKGVSPWLMMLAGITVLTQLIESTAKSCSQGTDDIVGSNRVIVLEEFMFLPAYVVMLALDVHRVTAIVLGLIAGDIVTGALAWLRLVRRGFFTGVERPTVATAKRIYRYGIKAQVGAVILLLNARLDFAIVGAFVGPAALGTYAIASRFAELLRLPSLAANYVLYPRFARRGAVSATDEARETMRKIGWIPAAAALPLGIAATFVLPVLYGHSFHSAIVPTYILLAGLTGTGFAGIISAYLYGAGRPDLNSWSMGAGLVVTVSMDLLLIPHLGITGAAIASAVAYITTVVALTINFRKVAGSGSTPGRTDLGGTTMILDENKVDAAASRVPGGAR